MLYGDAKEAVWRHRPRQRARAGGDRGAALLNQDRVRLAVYLITRCRGSLRTAASTAATCRSCGTRRGTGSAPPRCRSWSIAWRAASCARPEAIVEHAGLVVVDGLE